MARITVENNPGLTVESAINTFRQAFNDKCDVYPTRLPLRDFVVRQSEWTAVGIKIKRRRNRITFVFTAFTPSVVRRVLPVAAIPLGLVGGVLVYLVVHLTLKGTWRALEDEVASVIRRQFIPLEANPPSGFLETSGTTEASRWIWTLRMVLVSLFLSALTIFVAQNFVLIEVRLFTVSVEMRLGWGLMLAAGLGFAAGISVPKWRF